MEETLAVMEAVNGLVVVVQEVELAMDTQLRVVVILTRAVVVVVAHTLQEQCGEITEVMAHHLLGRVALVVLEVML